MFSEIQRLYGHKNRAEAVRLDLGPFLGDSLMRIYSVATTAPRFSRFPLLVLLAAAPYEGDDEGEDARCSQEQR